MRVAGIEPAGGLHAEQREQEQITLSTRCGTPPRLAAPVAVLLIDYIFSLRQAPVDPIPPDRIIADRHLVSFPVVIVNGSPLDFVILILPALAVAGLRPFPASFARAFQFVVHTFHAFVA